uniref:Uncharacterized protein n=1 Tax=Arundo donax TaxID=35708 RepID=A0A0A9GJ60_ARUDO
MQITYGICCVWVCQAGMRKETKRTVRSSSNVT